MSAKVWWRLACVGFSFGAVGVPRSRQSPSRAEENEPYQDDVPLGLD